jgi:hypothetical protein
MVYLRQSLVYLTLSLMLVTIWAIGYARECEARLERAQHAAASPEMKRAARILAEMDENAATMPSTMLPRD